MKTAEQRFWSRVEKTDDCWLWTAGKIGSGYGTIVVDGKQKLAHRFSYELHVGEIPDGLVMDHLCRVRHCVRPDHLEPVTQRENLARGETQWAVAARTNRCVRDHELTEAHVRSDGKRHCQECDNLRRREKRACA